MVLTPRDHAPAAGRRLATSALLLAVAALAFFGAGSFVLPVLLVTVALCLAVAVSALRRTASGADALLYRWRPSPGALLCLVAVLLLFLSTVPIPGALDGLHGRRRAEQNEVARAALREAVQVGFLDRTVPDRCAFTRNRAGSLRLVAHVILLICAAALVRGIAPERRAGLLIGLAGLGVAVAVAGHINQWYRPTRAAIWGLFPLPSGNPIGPFSHRNHFAGFAALFIPVCFALFIRAANARRYLQALAWPLAAALLYGVVLTSLSRGAVLSLAVMTVLLFVASLFRKSSHPLALLLLLFALGGLIVAQTPTRLGRVAADRLGTLQDPLETRSGQLRMNIWRDALLMWADYPITGVGGYAFGNVFSLYRTDDTRRGFRHADNEYVEFLADHGLLGLLFMLLLVGWTAHAWYEGAAERRVPGHFHLAALGALAVAGAHAAVDSALHSPLYSMTLVAIVACSLPAAVPGTAPPPAAPVPMPVLPAALSPVVLGTAAALLLALAIAIGGTDPFRTDFQEYQDGATPRAIGRALVENPTSHTAWLALGHRAMATADPRIYRFGLSCVARAVACNPRSYTMWEMLGYYYRGAGMLPEAQAAFERVHALRAWKPIPSPDNRAQY